MHCASANKWYICILRQRTKGKPALFTILQEEVLFVCWHYLKLTGLTTPDIKFETECRSFQKMIRLDTCSRNGEMAHFSASMHKSQQINRSNFKIKIESEADKPISTTHNFFRANANRFNYIIRPVFNELKNQYKKEICRFLTWNKIRDSGTRLFFVP